MILLFHRSTPFIVIRSLLTELFPFKRSSIFPSIPRAKNCMKIGITKRSSFVNERRMETKEKKKKKKKDKQEIERKSIFMASMLD